MKIEYKQVWYSNDSGNLASAIQVATTVGIWILSIWIPNFLNFGFQMVCIWQSFARADVGINPSDFSSKPYNDHLVFHLFSKLDQLDFKWSGFQILDPIRNLGHLQPNIYLTISIPD